MLPSVYMLACLLTLSRLIIVHSHGSTNLLVDFSGCHHNLANWLVTDLMKQIIR